MPGRVRAGRGSANGTESEVHVCRLQARPLHLPPVLWTTPAADVLKLRVHDDYCPVNAVFEGRLLSFCNTRCLQAYFAKHIRSKTDVDTER